VGVSSGDVAGASVLESDGYRFVEPVDPRDDDFDTQRHLNNAAIVRLFNDMRVAYVQRRVGAWWPAEIRANNLVIAARELHVLYESEGLPDERFFGGTKYTGRQGKAAVVEQRIVESSRGRAIARAWAVQLLVQQGKVVEWPARYFERVGEIEGREIPVRLRSPSRPWGPRR
jgi:acyl-CoA thioesterase FadM